MLTLRGPSTGSGNLRHSRVVTSRLLWNVLTIDLSSLQVAANYRVEVPIFKQWHKNIIGKGGATIKKVYSRSILTTV